MSNAGNADIFKQSFREEAREILVDLESALLELNDNRGDQELVGRVFRGLHTIKGSGAMFGFESMAAFTHNLETAFDEVRNGRLPIGSELIDLTLSALDQIRLMIEETGETAADPAVCAEILAKVRGLAGIKESLPEKMKSAAVGSGAGSASGASSGAESGSGSDAGAAAGQVREWAIHFAPGPDFMLNGTNPLLLVRELKQMGGLAVRASMAAIPPLAELDPERCYISWEMLLATAAGLDAIRDVFIFVEDSCELTIEPAASPAGEQTRRLRWEAQLRQARQRLEPARAGRQAGSVRRSGGRTGDRAGPAERTGGAQRRSGDRRSFGGDRAADLVLARELDDDPHDAHPGNL